MEELTALNIQSQADNLPPDASPETSKNPKKSELQEKAELLEASIGHSIENTIEKPLEKMEAIKERAENNKAVQLLTKITSAVILAALAALVIIGWRRGIFDSVESLQAWIDGFGMAAPLIFITLQALEVGIPVIPGGVTLVCGVVMFGPWWGFWYNYIGIVIGSLIVFAISRAYGKPLMYRLFSAESIEKYEHWTDDRGRFAKLFAAAIFLPGAPDGLICYLAGTTKMSWKTYSLIILLCKPLSIALYSLGLFSLSKGVSAIG